MNRKASFTSIALALFMTLPLAAFAAQPQSPRVLTARGTVMYVGPLSFAIDTGTRIETFKIPPSAQWTYLLRPTERVKVSYEGRTEGPRSVVAVESTARSSSAIPASQRDLEMKGDVVYVTPRVLAVETSHGREYFEFAKGSHVKVEPGESVDVFYRAEPQRGHHVIARVTVVRRPMAATGSPQAQPAGMMRAANYPTATGSIALVTRHRLYLDTTQGLREFRIGSPAELAQLTPGAQIRVWFRSQKRPAVPLIIKHEREADQPALY